MTARHDDEALLALHAHDALVALRRRNRLCNDCARNRRRCRNGRLCRRRVPLKRLLPLILERLAMRLRHAEIQLDRVHVGSQRGHLGVDCRQLGSPLALDLCLGIALSCLVLTRRNGARDKVEYRFFR